MKLQILCHSRGRHFHESTVSGDQEYKLYGVQMHEQSSGVQLVACLTSFCNGALAKTSLHIVAPLSASALFLHVKAWTGHYEYELGCHRGLVRRCVAGYPCFWSSGAGGCAWLAIGRRVFQASIRKENLHMHAVMPMSTSPYARLSQKGARIKGPEFGKKLIFIYTS